MTTLTVDLETRSVLDLRQVGVHAYATHPTTDVWCMAYAFGDEDVQLWVLGEPPPDRISQHVSSGGMIRAWNAMFERTVWREILGPRYGFPVPALEQWYCLAAQAAAMALPRKLGDAAKVLRTGVEKDTGGHALVLRMCRPRSRKAHIAWWDDPDRLSRLYEYCKQDVRTERAVARHLRPLTEAERWLYLLDQTVNDRGVRVDVPLVRAAQKIVAEGVARAGVRLAELTGGAVTQVTQTEKLTAWCRQRAAEIHDLRKSTVRDILKEELPDDVREALSIRRDAAKSSTAKLRSMIECRGPDDRVRGMLLYHGASTGRWAGKLVQPQNFPRGEVKNAESLIPLVLTGEYDKLPASPPPLHVVSSLLRACFVPAFGHRFVAGDFSQIEARVLAWIAKQDDLVRAFANNDPIYERMAARIYGLPVSKIGKGSRERQIGKNVVLGAGYQMGAKKFRKTVSEQVGIDLTEQEAEAAIVAYRTQYRNIVQFWWDIDQAAFRAVRTPGQITACGRGDRIKFVVRGRFLWCVLPAKRPLAYMNPRIASTVTPSGDTRLSVVFDGMNTYTHRWGPRYGYGGLWTENVVQAMSRDLLADAMRRVEHAEYPVVLTVHDEILCEVPNGRGSLREFLDIIQQTPPWAADLPVAAEGWEGDRYKK